MQLLQSRALPLGYPAVTGAQLTRIPPAQQGPKIGRERGTLSEAMRFYRLFVVRFSSALVVQWLPWNLYRTVAEQTHPTTTAPQTQVSPSRLRQPVRLASERPRIQRA